MCSRSRRYAKSGSTRSTPRCSSRGNARPASTTTIESSASYTVMFLPTSPRPPSGMILQVPNAKSLGRGGAEHARTLQARAYLVDLVVRRLDHRQTEAAGLVAEEVQRRLDRDRVRDDSQEVEGRRHLVVQAPRAVDVALLEAADHLLRLRPPDVRVDADAADAAELQEREDQVVVARIEVEAEAGDAARLLDVDDDATRDVVDDDRLVGARGDLLEMADDRALRRLRVVRRDDEEAVDAELLRTLRQLRRVARVVRPGPGDDRRAVADGVTRRGEELQLLVVRERRALARRAGDDEAVGAVVDEELRELAELLEVDGAVRTERRHDRRQHL